MGVLKKLTFYYMDIIFIICYISISLPRHLYCLNFCINVLIRFDINQKQYKFLIKSKFIEGKIIYFYTLVISI